MIKIPPLLSHLSEQIKFGSILFYGGGKGSPSTDTKIYRETTMLEKLTAYEYDTDKNEIYLNNYERYFRSMKDGRINLLELGVFRGGSLLMWRDYFASGVISGVDVNQVSVEDESGRIRIYRGMQQDKDFLDLVAEDSTGGEGFDIIIDDASHIGELTKISFWHLFHFHLKPGGIYVIEDWRTAYWDKFVDGAAYKRPREKSDVGPTERIKDKIRNLSKALPPNSGIQRVVAKALGTPKSSPMKKRFPSHDYGMVGFIKELVDELGMDMITNPSRGYKGKQRMPVFSRMEICPGQVFIVKNA